MMIKVCGMKHSENIEAIAGFGPDMLGLIFYEKSPRFFTGSLPAVPDKLKLVGVFVNEDIDTVTEKAVKYHLDYLQLHGDESPGYCNTLKAALHKAGSAAELIKVFSIGGEGDLDDCRAYEACANYFLFDTKGKHRGGNGLRFDWEVLNAYQLQTPFLLSGGIGPEDVEDLYDFMRSEGGKRCAGIDINSGFELEPGLKNEQSVKRFISRMREIENIKK